MANLNKGQVSAPVGDTTYILRIATNEWCELEDEFGKPTTEIVTEFFDMVTAGTLRMKFIRSVFRAALIGEMPEITHDEAGAIMSDIGLVEAAGLLGKAIMASMPDATEDEGKPNPPKAATSKSTGRRSSSPG